MTHDTSTALNEHHRKEIMEASAIDPAVALERGYATVARPKAGLLDAFGRDTREVLKAMGFPGWAIREDYYYPGLHIPQYTPHGIRYAGQFKPARAVPNREGKPMRYASAKGAARLDVHPRWSADRGGMQLPAIQDPSERLWITEGVKKADALTSRGCVTVALAGVYMWRNTHAALGDWEDVRLRGREIVICFDADAVTKPHVAQAMARLGKWLTHKGAAKVWYVLPPGGPKGVDDYFASGGTLRALEQAMTTRPPQVVTGEDVFTDSALAEQVARAVLEDAYCRTSALGWLRYNGRLWTPCEPGEVTEAVRQHFREQYAEALTRESEDVAAGRTPSGVTELWRKTQSASKINAVASLAGNIDGVLRDAAIFDTDPDVLNTPGGLVNLATLEIMPHSPDHLCTKITAVAYRPGAEHEAVKAALDAVPAEVLDWLQVRMGQALTGYAADDGRMLLLTGGGKNGKTTLLGAAFRVLGGGQGDRGYAAKVPNTLLLKGRAAGGATPEKMTLRGTRLAYMEETPEEGYLDSTMVKELMDAEEIDGRHLYKSTTTWKPTHSIFLNTNHAPVVTDTGDGTWRRLLRVDFPYRYRGPGQELTRETDRLGDPGLKTRMATSEAQEALLAWMVAGAQRWYAAGGSLEAVLPEPGAVTASVQAWRVASDDVLRFFADRMVLRADAWVTAESLYGAFTEWCHVNGHRIMSSREFAKRLQGHGGIPEYVVQHVVRSNRPGRSSRPGVAIGSAETVRAVLGLAFLSS